METYNKKEVVHKSYKESYTEKSYIEYSKLKDECKQLQSFEEISKLKSRFSHGPDIP